MGTSGLKTADDLNVELCTLGGTEHDYRSKTYEVYPGCQRTSLVCVWCSGVACGYPSETDPCIEPYHHAGDHRTAVPVTAAAPETFTGELGTLTVKLHIDHAWLAAHIATHDEVG